MNKVIFTDPRLFMAVVGPSGSGKTQLVFRMLLEGTFRPRFQKIYYFYNEYQTIFDHVRTKIDIEFIPCIDFDMIEKVENCLLIFDDSCDDIYSEKRFLKLATSGRHRGIHVIYIKHNLFFQSKFSKTIDLNTSHVILFKSPRDIHQVKIFAKQMASKGNFLETCYVKATEQPFGHLLIDLDPRTPDYLRYCSNIVGPGPSIFYLPSSKAIETEISNVREKLGYTEALYKSQETSAAFIP
jgi:hypothetical protein